MKVSVAPQGSQLKVSQSLVQSITPSQQMAVRSVAQTLPAQALTAQGVKSVLATPDRTVQGLFHI